MSQSRMSFRSLNRAAVLPVLFLFVGPSDGEEKQLADPPIKLRVTDTIVVGGVAAPAGLLIRNDTVCDSDGNVSLIRLLPPVQGGPQPTALLRISADGKRVTSLEIPTRESKEHMVIAMAVDADDELYVLTGSEHGQFILQFSSDGKLQSSTRFDAAEASGLPEVAIVSLAVFGSDLFLAAGLSRSEPSQVTPILGVFHRDGHLAASVELDRHPESDRLPERKGGRPLNQLEFAAPGEDGNIYLVRATRKGPILGISPSGDVVRRIDLVPPKGAAKAVLTTMKISGSRMALEYRTEGKDSIGRSRIVVYHLSSGRVIADYVAPDLRGPLVCYSWSDVSGDVFTTWGISKEGRLEFVQYSR